MIEKQTNMLEHTELAASSQPTGTARLIERANSSAEEETAQRAERSLFAGNELNDLRQHWRDVQQGFVDDPRTAVRNADELVARVMTRLAEVFAGERAQLEHVWDKGESVSTEDLRVALRRYRAFFDRLLGF